MEKQNLHIPVLIGIIACFLFIFFSDWIIHGIVLKSYYEASNHLWRPMGEQIFWAMILGQILVPVIFAVIFTKLVQDQSPQSGAKTGFYLGVFSLPHQLVMYAVVPYPAMLSLIWVVAATLQMSAMGWIFATCRQKILGKK